LSGRRRWLPVRGGSPGRDLGCRGDGVRDAYQLSESSLSRRQGAPANGVEGRGPTGVGDNIRRRICGADAATGRRVRHFRRDLARAVSGLVETATIDALGSG